MRRLSSLFLAAPITGLLLLPVLFNASGCASTAMARESRTENQAGNDELRAEVRKQCATMEQAMRDNDLARVASFYTDDAILLGPDRYERGGSREAIDEYWAGFGQGVDWSLVTHSVDGVDGLIVQRGESILTYIRNGDRRTSIVDFTLVWQRQEDGVLKIRVDAYW